MEHQSSSHNGQGARNRYKLVATPLRRPEAAGKPSNRLGTDKDVKKTSGEEDGFVFRRSQRSKNSHNAAQHVEQANSRAQPEDIEFAELNMLPTVHNLFVKRREAYASQDNRQPKRSKLSTRIIYPQRVLTSEESVELDILLKTGTYRENIVTQFLLDLAKGESKFLSDMQLSLSLPLLDITLRAILDKFATSVKELVRLEMPITVLQTTVPGKSEQLQSYQHKLEKAYTSLKQEERKWLELQNHQDKSGGKQLTDTEKVLKTVSIDTREDNLAIVFSQMMDRIRLQVGSLGGALGDIQQILDSAESCQEMIARSFHGHHFRGYALNEDTKRLISSMTQGIKNGP